MRKRMLSLVIALVLLPLCWAGDVYGVVPQNAQPVFLEQPEEKPPPPPLNIPEDPIQKAPPQPEPEPEEQWPKAFTLVSVGDLMVHGEQLEDAYQEDSGSYDFSHCFSWVAEDLKEGHLTIGNLETVLGGEEIGYSDYPCFNSPDSYGQALAESGFHFLTTANNHCLDKGESGLLRTLEVLDGLGIAHTGTFASGKERDSILMMEAEGFQIALLSYTFSTNGIPVPQGKEYLVNMIEEDLIIADLERAKALEPDLIVVLPHTGNEYELEPNSTYTMWMDFFVRHGADVVLASHPHVLQRMEVKEVVEEDGSSRNAFVIYSLGNFISSQRYEPRECSIVLKLDFVQQSEEASLELAGVRFVPTWVQFKDSSGQYAVRVLPVADAIQAYHEGNEELGLREWDLDRLYRVNDWVTRLYLGEAVDREHVQREYAYYGG